MSKLASLTHFSPSILDKIQTRVFLISNFLVKSLMPKTFTASSTRNDIEMKLRSISKIKKKIGRRQKIQQ